MHLFYLGFAMTLVQKVSHVVSEEGSTLEREEAKGGDEVVRSEWAHVTFFPALLLHTVVDKLERKGEKRA